MILILPYAHIPAAKRILGALLALGACAWIQSQRAWDELPIRGPFLAWLAWIAISATWASDTLASLQAVWMDACVPAVCFSFCALLCRQEKSFRQLLQLSLLSLTCFCVLAILLKWLGPPDAIYKTQDYTDGWMRYYPGAGRASAYLLAMLPLTWAYAAFGKKETAIACGVTALACLAALYTENRIIWPALTAATFVVVLCTQGLRSKKNWPFIAGLTLTLLVVAFGGLYFLSKTRLNLHGDFMQVMQAVLSSDSRPKAWIVWGQHYAQHWLQGWGFGWRLLEGSLSAAQFRTLNGYEHFVTTHPHNFLLSIAVQTGTVGLLCVLALLASCARIFIRALRARHTEQRFIAACGIALIVAVFLRNMTDDFFNGASVLAFWISAGILVGRVLHLRNRDIAPIQ